MLHKPFRTLVATCAGIGLLAAMSACSSVAPPAATQPAPNAAPAQKDLLDTIKERGVMRVSTDANYAPQSFFDEKTKAWTGFDVDTAQEVARRLGVKVEFVTPQWDAVTSGNWAGRWDVSIGSMTITPDRQKVLDFTPPYYYSVAQFAVRADLKDTIKTLDNLAGKTVCVAKSTTYEDYVNGKVDMQGVSVQPPKNIKVASVETDQLCIQTIQSGRKDYDAVLTAANVVNDGIQKGAPIVMLGKPVFSEPLGVSVDKSSAPNSKFVAALSKAITDMHSDGTLTRLAMKYYGYDISVQPK